MWQSKKSHTSFVKSFLRHEPETEPECWGQELQRPKKNRHQPTVKQKNPKAEDPQGGLRDLMETRGFGEGEIFLKVLGI